MLGSPFELGYMLGSFDWTLDGFKDVFFELGLEFVFVATFGIMPDPDTIS